MHPVCYKFRQELKIIQKVYDSPSLSLPPPPLLPPTKCDPVQLTGCENPVTILLLSLRPSKTELNSSVFKFQDWSYSDEKDLENAPNPLKNRKDDYLHILISPWNPYARPTKGIIGLEINVHILCKVQHDLQGNIFHDINWMSTVCDH